MTRQIVALGLLCGSLVFAQPVNAQGFAYGGPGFVGFGFGSPMLAYPGFGAIGLAPPGFGTVGLYGAGVSPYGFGNAAFFGGYAPATFAYPVAAGPVYVARPVVAGGAVPVYAPRPAVRVPLNRAYRRVWRRGW